MDGQGALRAVCGCDSLSLRVEHIERDLAGADGFHAVTQRAVHVRVERHAVDVGLRRRIQADGPGDAGVVEEVKVRQVDALLLLAQLAGLHRGDAGVVRAEESDAALIADRQRAVTDAVVHAHEQLKGFAALRQRGDVRFKRKEAAAVAAELAPVQPDDGVVRHGVKAQHAALPRKASGEGHPRAVPAEADVAAKAAVGLLVVVGGGNGDGLPGVALAQAEIPDAAKVEDGTRGIHLWGDHDDSPSAGISYCSRIERSHSRTGRQVTLRSLTVFFLNRFAIWERWGISSPNPPARGPVPRPLLRFVPISRFF